MQYVIIGNGVAGITAAFALRKRDPDACISVVSGESDYFVSRTALMYAYMDRMNLRDLEPFERKAYDKQRIRRIRGRVTDLRAGRHTLQLDDGSEISYDRLLLATGSVPRTFSAPGLDQVKDGIVHFVSLQDLAECERLTPTARRAVVVGGGLIGVELVECLVHHGIEVDFLVRDSWYWPMALDKAEGTIIANHIRHSGVRLHLDHEVAEVVPDANGRVSKVRTKQGAEFPCDMLGVCIGVRPAIDWLKTVTPPLALGRGIQVSADFRTSVPDIWAAGDCAEFAGPNGRPIVEQIWYSAKRHGELAAQSMLGDTVHYQPPLFYNSAKFFEVEYTTVGDVTRVPEGADSFFYQVPGKNITLRVIEMDGAVIGFNMLGSRWNHTWFEKWIHERKSMKEVMANLHRAQFDVEFGRISLDGARAAFAGRAK